MSSSSSSMSSSVSAIVAINNALSRVFLPKDWPDVHPDCIKKVVKVMQARAQAMRESQEANVTLQERVQTEEEKNEALKTGC